MKKSFFLLSLFFMQVLIVSAQDRKTKRRLEQQVKEAEQHYKQSKTEDTTKLLYAKIGAPLLPFQFLNAKQELVTLSEIPSNQPIVLAFFNPMCDHCLDAAKLIMKHIDQFKDISILFVTGMNLLEELNHFSEIAGTLEQKNFIVCASKEEYTSQLFEGKGIPQIMLYNKKHLLQKTFYKEIDIEAALTYLNN